jgi:hypothetical protein
LAEHQKTCSPIVEQNWCSDAKSLQGLSREQWKDMKIYVAHASWHYRLPRCRECRGRFGSDARNHQLAAFSENTTQKHATVRTQYIHTYVYIVVDVFDDYVFDCIHT